MAEIASLAERPAEGAPSHGLVARYLVVERRRETRLGDAAIARSGGARHGGLELAPPLARALAFAAQQPEPLGPQEQPGMLGEDGHRIAGRDLRLEKNHRRQRHKRELCPHQNRLCHSDTAPARPLPTTNPNYVEKIVVSKAVRDIDTWFSDCYLLSELAK